MNKYSLSVITISLFLISPPLFADTDTVVYVPLGKCDQAIRIDALHKDLHHNIGHSAMQYQFLSDKNTKSRITVSKPSR